MKPLLLILATLTVLLPTAAQAAGLRMAGGTRERVPLREREAPPRKGIAVGASVMPGAIGMSGTFVPAIRAQYEVGGGVTDRFTLGVALGGTAYLGLDKGSFNADVVGTRFFGRGAWLRAGLGVTSHSPALASVPTSPALGGTIGLGYEFRLFKRVGLGLGADYDLRVRTDGRLAHGMFLALRFTGYIKGKKH
ncbi:MAG: hypothetical protein K0V04_44460 [Deltaproteobacteria bacterium]|nr:hypothetical protein [Deltaproteobacteria bacterium]